MKYPSWLTRKSNGTFLCSGDIYYPDILRELEDSVDLEKDFKITNGEGPLDPVGKDQYWLEVAYQCLKLDVQAFVLLNAVDPRRSDTGSRSLEIHIRANKPTWALKNNPEGRGMRAATQGKEAREHYRNLRGYLSM